MTAVTCKFDCGPISDQDNMFSSQIPSRSGNLTIVIGPAYQVRLPRFNVTVQKGDWFDLPQEDFLNIASHL